jgi:glycosyltransferase involved in cell wall biosynthesis
MPAYNAAATIERTIQSALMQTYEHFELIIIDDGSKDETVQRVQSFTDPRIRLCSYPNGGHSVARNRGIRLAEGEYIAFLDADDRWSADKLEAQLHALCRNPQAGLAYSWVDYVDITDRFLHAGTRIKLNGNAYPKLLNGNFLESGSNPLIRKAAIDRVGGFDPALRTATDWDMWLRIAACYPFVCVPTPQIYYRVLLDSVSANLPQMEQCCLHILKKNFADAPPNLQVRQPACLSNLYLYLALRSLEVNRSRSQCWQSIRYLRLAIQHQPQMLKQRSRLAAITLTKLLASLLISPRGMRSGLSRLKHLFSGEKKKWGMVNELMCDK